MTRPAGATHRYRQRNLRAGDRLVKADRYLRLQIIATLHPRAPGTHTVTVTAADPQIFNTSGSTVFEWKTPLPADERSTRRNRAASLPRPP